MSTNNRLIPIAIWASPLIAACIALFVGAYNVPPLVILKIIGSAILPLPDVPDIPEKAILLDIRLPRVILAALAGGALSLSGVTLQGMFRNPLVDPFILGISAGAALGCALSIGFFPWLPLPVAAFVFGIGAVALTYSAATTRGELSRLPLILSGVVVSAFFTALVSTVKFLVDPHKLQNIVYWLMGSFALADWGQVKIAAAGIGAGALPVWLMRWRLNVMSMGDDEARALGVNVARDRLIFIAATALMASVAVSLSGIIGWVGLIVPHLVRMMTGPDHRTLVPLSIAGGAAFMIISDTVARNVSAYDIPIGIITAILGAPFFIYLMKTSGREGWGR